MPSPGRVCAIALVALLSAAPSLAETRRVELPLRIPMAFLERLLVEQVFSEPETSARIVPTAESCNEIVLSQPALRPLGGRIFVTAHGRAQAGFSLFGTCYRPFAWEGEVEAEEDARLARDAAAVEFRVVNSWLEDESEWLAVPALWDWVKPVVHPRLEALRIDLEPLLHDLRRALPLFAARREEPALRRLVESLALGEARVEEQGLVLTLRFDVETARPEPAPAPEAPLTAGEIAAFEAMLHGWDAFVTFVIKTAGQDALEPALRATLLAVLLDARHEMVAALGEPARDGEDRMRSLFRSSWAKLQPALAPLAGGRQGFRYLAFVASGDALAALDAVGPAYGFEISDDGLLRLARTLVPEAGEDPLRWSEEVDPALRETFGFEAELPALPPLPPPPEPEGEPEAAPAPEPAPEAAPGAALRLLDWLFPAAFAAPDPLPKPGPHSSPLDGVAPRIADLDSYLPQVATLLREASAQVFAHGRLGAERRELFERMVLATAWQESCWRQYVRRRGAVEPLRSSAGALGLMQVNPHVWRGFYAVDGLAWSIGYNARAGSEILLHYLRDLAIARGEEAAGGPDALARASYAAYHGGPSHLRRYRQPSRWRKPLVAIDRAFHAKLLEVAAGRELGVRECFAG
jgi:soluble lytic murein transglycosylase-like protein